MAWLSSVNLFARNLEGLVSFYAGLFDLPEKPELRSPIYRALDGGGVMIGFNGLEAYRLLNLDPSVAPAGTRSLLTFDVEDVGEVARLSGEAVKSGAVLMKPPYDTAYGSRQAVLLDPEGNIFRINAFRSAETPSS
jgi:predicted enzyme related to lactoylglutathione lyase